METPATEPIDCRSKLDPADGRDRAARSRVPLERGIVNPLVYTVPIRKLEVKSIDPFRTLLIESYVQ